MASNFKPLIEIPSPKVAVFRARLDAVVDERLLSEVERRRAEKYGRSDLRRRFVARRTALRLLLGDHLGIAPEALVVTTSPFGQPQVAECHFSVSSRDDDALIAISATHAIGVDIERADADFPIAETRDCFAPDELHDDLWRAWTAKEATAKALGIGLAAPLAELVVRQNHVRTPWGRLALHSVPLPSPLVASLAIVASRESNAMAASSIVAL